MVNYCIFVHSNPPQLKLLVKNIHEVGKSRCFIHVDKKVDISEYYINDIDIFYIENRISVVWGTSSVVSSIVQCLSFALSKVDNGYFILLSGSDFPLHQKSSIFDFINKNNDKVFMKVDFIPSYSLKNFGCDRIDRYWFNIGSSRTLVSIKPFTLTLSNILSLYRILRYNRSNIFIAFCCLFKKISFNKDFLLLYSEMWWSAPFQCVKALLFEYNNGYFFYSMFNRMKIPDETILQSIIYNKIVPNSNYILINKLLTFIEWSKFRWPRPTTFLIEDMWQINKIKQDSDYLFIRKVDYVLAKRLDTIYNN